MAQAAIKYPHSYLWPTKEHYLWLLRQEASRRGFLFNSRDIELPDADFSWPQGDEEPGLCIEREPWLEDEWSMDHESPDRLRNDQQIDYANITDSSKRGALLKSYAWLYLNGIRKSIAKQLLGYGLTVSLDPCPITATLRDLGSLWTSKCSESSKTKEVQIQVGVFSDVPQEDTSIHFVDIPCNLDFESFKKQIAAMDIVRYLTSKYHPRYASTVFLDDSIVYHHPYPTAIDATGPSHLAEIYPTTRDYDAPQSGWYSHLVLIDTEGMLNKVHDWRAIDTEEDWQSLLKCLRTSSVKAFMRHKSVEDRMAFIRQHKEREKLQMAKTGGHYQNCFLNRHMESLDPDGKHQVPVSPDKDLSGEEWKRRVVDQSRRRGEVLDDEAAFFRDL